jgi:hypothetical protein
MGPPSKNVRQRNASKSQRRSLKHLPARQSFWLIVHD